MEYRVIEIELQSKLPFLSNVLIFLFGRFCEDLRAPPMYLDIEARCNEMAKHGFKPVEQLAVAGRNGRTRTILVTFERKGGEN